MTHTTLESVHIEVPLRIRLSDLPLAHIQSFGSKKAWKKSIKNGEVLVNGIVAQTGTWIVGSNELRILESKKLSGPVYERQLEIVHEDDDLAIINKPAGLSVSGNQFKTVQQALSFNLSPSSLPDKLTIFRPVHRLDRATSGLLLIAKTSSSIKSLTNQFETRTIKKTYTALVHGKLTEQGEIISPIDNRSAHSTYMPVRSFRSAKNNWLTLVELSPLTGRTHQLRIHLNSISHPIFGDQLYNDDTIKSKGLFLAATAIKFQHPRSQQPLQFVIPAPHKFLAQAEREERMWHKASQETAQRNSESPE